MDWSRKRLILYRHILVMPDIIHTKPFRGKTLQCTAHCWSCPSRWIRDGPVGIRGRGCPSTRRWSGSPSGTHPPFSRIRNKKGDENRELPVETKANCSGSTAPKTGIETGNTGNVFIFHSRESNCFFGPPLDSENVPPITYRSTTQSYGSTPLPSRLLEKKQGWKQGKQGNPCRNNANRSESTATKTGIKTGKTGNVFYFSLERALAFSVDSQNVPTITYRSTTQSYGSTLLPSRVLEK